MATISPTIVTGTPALQVDTGIPGVNYTTILNMLGPWSFIADSIYYRPQNFNQFTNPLGYSNFEMNSNYVAAMTETYTNPMDFLPVMFVQAKGRGMVFEGTGCLFFNLLAHESVQLFFMGKEVLYTRGLNKIQPDNFTKLENQMGMPNFFKDYKDEI